MKFLKWFVIGSVTLLILVIVLVALSGGDSEPPVTTKAIEPPSSPISTIPPSSTATPSPTPTTPPPTSRPAPTVSANFDGNGDSVLGPFELVDGIAILTASHSGTKNFIVQLIGAKGGEDYSINAIGAYNGSRGHSIPGRIGRLQADEYRLNVTADGAWRIGVSQEFPSTGETPPIQLRGQGDEVLKWFTLDKGTYLIKSTHSGSKNFIVALMNVNGSSDKFIINEIGDYTGEQLVKVEQDNLGLSLSPGTYAFVVQADGEWAITVEQ